MYVASMVHMALVDGLTMHCRRRDMYNIMSKACKLSSRSGRAGAQCLPP